MFRKRVLLPLLIACLPALHAQTLEIQTHQLANGMKILVQEDPSIPNIAFYTFYRVGSRNEHEGITGLSHFFEHMMFNGARKYGKGEFDHAMEGAGGNNNAYTSNDVTVYQDWVPASALELIFDLEADRIQYLAFDPKVVESERQVVYSERRLSVDNNNFGILDEQLEAAAIQAHPYHWPVIGWPSDIEKWTIDDLKTYHAMAYSPTNATVIVVGAVKAADVFALADKYFAPIPAHDPPPAVRTVEPAQLGERRILVRKFAQLPILAVAYHAPNAVSPDYYAVSLLNTLLTTGESSRLYRSLVDQQQLALSVEPQFGPRFDPTLIEFFMQPRAGVAPEKLETAFYAEIDKLKAAPIDEHELQKARNQAIAAHYRSLRSINERANTIGEYQVLFGDWHKVMSVEDEYNKVTAADIQRVARQYFGADDRTVATLIPDASKKAGDGDAAEGTN
jgi:zinc protease